MGTRDKRKDLIDASIEYAMENGVEEALTLFSNILFSFGKKINDKFLVININSNRNQGGTVIMYVRDKDEDSVGVGDAVAKALGQKTITESIEEAKNVKTH